MNLNEWCKKVEDIVVPLRIQYWNMQVGLPYDEKNIGELEQQNAKYAEELLKNWKDPEDLVDDCIGSVASAQTYKLSLEFNELHSTAVVSKKHKFKDKPVTWQTWRQFAAAAPDKARKEVYDEFVTLTKPLAENAQKRFDVITNLAKQYGTDPLDSYCRGHRMSFAKLKEVIEELRDGTKKQFGKQFDVYANEIFKRSPKYFDDFYVVRNKLYDKISMPKLDPIASVQKTLRGMGFDPAGVHVDADDRPGKYASPFMVGIQVPKDIRLSYKPENPFNDLNSVYHEYGHCIHHRVIDPKLPYWTRNIMSSGLAETFSIFFDKMLVNPVFLQDLGFTEEQIDDLVQRTRFQELYGAEFYCANSLFKFDFWEKNVAVADAAPLYAKRIKQCMGMDIPGEYWLLHHILPESLVTVPSYMLAEMQVANLHAKYEDEYGERWWTSKECGNELLALMKPGSDSPAANFSKISAKQLVKNLN